RSKDPLHHPSILFNYMSTGQDWSEFCTGIRITRDIMRQPALTPYAGREITPGEASQSDAELDAFVRDHAETAFHPAGTNAMGLGDMAIVDTQGRVHGLEGLRVVDASVMPEITTGNLNAPTIMMAEKIADLIRGRAPLSRLEIPDYTANGVPARR
ncbi:MAG: GMC oxidoreductase, partial [Polaromonas sp.]|nr:GMC oxidoreductase [Polaromonas sp.]